MLWVNEQDLSPCTCISHTPPLGVCALSSGPSSVGLDLAPQVLRGGSLWDALRAAEL